MTPKGEKDMSQYSELWVDPTSIFSGITAALNFIPSLSANRQAKKNYEYQKEWNEKNFAFMQENQQYERALQQTMFNREDTAIQRRMADMKAGGINPILAAGQGASAGPVVASHAPQMESPDISGVMSAAEKKMASMQMVMNALKMKADIDHTNADTRRIDMQTKKDEWSMEHEEKKFDVELRKLDIELSRLGIDSDRLVLAHKEYLINASKHELEKNYYVLNKNKQEIENILNQARTRQINEQIATEQLRQQQVSAEVARLLLHYDIDVSDFAYSQRVGMRFKDSGDYLSQTGYRIHGIVDSAMNSIGDKISGNRTHRGNQTTGSNFRGNNNYGWKGGR
jgi:hypothetical protein